LLRFGGERSGVRKPLSPLSFASGRGGRIGPFQRVRHPRTRISSSSSGERGKGSTTTFLLRHCTPSWFMPEADGENHQDRQGDGRRQGKGRRELFASLLTYPAGKKVPAQHAQAAGEADQGLGAGPNVAGRPAVDEDLACDQETADEQSIQAQ